MKKEKEVKEIKIDYFHVDGYKHSITFFPDNEETKYQIMNEHTYKIVIKGVV
tara:strand:+ start:476 stop:631 length:156 start_codon:yes stop_codon:yes gene_type:complete